MPVLSIRKLIAMNDLQDTLQQHFSKITTKHWLPGKCKCLKWYFNQKFKFYHHLITLMSFQTHKTFIFETKIVIFF